MVVVHRFRWFGWFVLCVGVILACYLMSSRVAAERNRLSDIEKAIASTERDIKALETEFDTRASFVQLNRWNTDTLKLSSPTEGQYVRDDAQLASLDMDSTAGAPIQTGAQTASATSAPAVPTPKPVPDVATATQRTASAPAPVRAAVAMVGSPTAAKAQPAAATKPKPRPMTVALLDRKLLGDIERGARSEGRGQ